MREEYIRDYKIPEKTDEEKRIELIRSVIKTKQDLANFNNNFQYVEEDLVDYYAYQIKANKTKLDYLMKSAKKQGIKLDVLTEKYLRKNNVI